MVVVEQLEIHSPAYLNLGSSGKGGEHAMPCFRSQLTNLRCNFGSPRVPRQSDYVIWHMVRCNIEAYANR